MPDIVVREHSMLGWRDYAKQIGFVPDPMVLRTGEIFLAGISGIGPLRQKDFDVWRALSENLKGLSDFFDMLVTRDVIPLIDYGLTFENLTDVPLGRRLSSFIRPVHVAYAVYDEVKKGALKALDQVDIDLLGKFGQLIVNETEAFRYEWVPGFDVEDGSAEFAAIGKKFDALGDPRTSLAAQFLLGAFIFGGYAQASGTAHYIQPKRSRFFLGLVAPSDQVLGFSHREEDEIFAATMKLLKGEKADVVSTDLVPPVLPYLLSKGDPANVDELLDRALSFRETPEGKAYRQIVSDIREDGVKARVAESALRRERQNALLFLDPYGKLAEEARSIVVNVSLETVGLPVKAEANAPVKLKIPVGLQLWWNDHTPFGSVHRVLRRMWMDDASYKDFDKKLKTVWQQS
jgi:hypothetical protein